MEQRISKTLQNPELKHEKARYPYLDAKKFAAFPKLIPREHALVGVQITIAFVLTQSGIRTF